MYWKQKNSHNLTYKSHFSHSSVKRTNPVKIITDGFRVCFLERTTIRKPVLAWGRARDMNNSNMGNCAPPG